MIRSAALLLLSVLFVSCAQSIKRQAHVLPVFEGQLLNSASPRFIPAEADVDCLTPELRPPRQLAVSRLEDGSFLITWISTTRRAEKLIFLDSGIHPVGVPDEAITEAFDPRQNIPIDEPFILTGFGQNTAYIREYVDLRPLPKKRTSRSTEPPTRREFNPS